MRGNVHRRGLALLVVFLTAPLRPEHPIDLQLYLVEVGRSIGVPDAWSESIESVQRFLSRLQFTGAEEFPRCRQN